VIFHESRQLPDSQVKVLKGLPVTTLERTLFDLAGTGRAKRADRATDNALVKRLTTTERLWEVWAELAAPNRPGTTELRRILLKRAPGYVAKESVLEHRFSELLEPTDLERPEWQVNLGGEEWVGRVDAYFRRARLVVELDGRVGHVGDLDRARDRARDNELMADGWRVLRFTWDDLVSRPAWVLSTLRRALVSAA
jgi:very-short-patch-repair endonuclease